MSAFWQTRLASYLIFSLVILTDQISKFFLASNCNAGVAFGFLGSNKLLVVALSAFVLLVCFYYLKRTSERFTFIALSLILAGGTSNLIDRVVVGCVRDFINFGFFPSFNLADSAITIGIATIMLKFIFTEGKKEGYTS